MNLGIGITVFNKLRSLVDDRVFPDVVPIETAEESYIVYKTESSETMRDLSGSIRVALLEVVIICYNTETDNTDILANSIQSALDNQSDLPNGIDKILFTDRSGDFNAEVGLWFEALTFTFYKTA